MNIDLSGIYGSTIVCMCVGIQSLMVVPHCHSSAQSCMAQSKLHLCCRSYSLTLCQAPHCTSCVLAYLSVMVSALYHVESCSTLCHVTVNQSPATTGHDHVHGL